MNKINKIILIIISFILIIFGTLFIVAGIANDQIMSQLEDNGITVKGVVTDKKAIDSGRYTEYNIEVTYLAKDEKTITHVFYVDEDVFEQTQKTNQVTITYVPGRPDWIILGEEFNYDRRPFYLGILAFILGFFLLFIAFSSFKIIKSAWLKKN